MGRKARNSALKEAPVTEATEWLNPSHPCRGANRVVDAARGQVELLTPDGSEQRKKFALIGFSTATRHMAPLDDPEWAVVGMNQLAQHLRHPVVKDGTVVRDGDGKAETVLRAPDLWFEIHRVWNTAIVPGTDHEGWLRDSGVPCYMTDVVEELPTSMAFPVERLIKKFDIDYFTSTVSYMVVWAIDHIDQLVEARLKDYEFGGVTSKNSVDDVRKLVDSIYAEYTIGVFGIDLVVGEEYEEQRPAAEFWLGQAMARNITLMIPGQSALLKQHYRYGYEMEPEGLVRGSDFDKRMPELRNAHQEASETAIELFGRIKELEDYPEGEEKLEARRLELTAAHREASEKVVHYHGRIEELKHWEGFMRLRQNGAEM